jgi:hypothetical protein
MMCSMRRKNHNDRNLCSSLISTRKPSKENAREKGGALLTIITKSKNG